MATTAPTIVGTRELEKLTFLTVRQVAELSQTTAEHVRRQWRADKLPGAEMVLGVLRIRTSVFLGDQDGSTGTTEETPSS